MGKRRRIPAQEHKNAPIATEQDQDVTSFRNLGEVPQRLKSNSHRLVGSAPLDEPRRRRKGRPDKLTRDGKRRMRKLPPEDEREARRRENSHIMREKDKQSADSDGPAAGPLRTVSYIVAREHAQSHDPPITDERTIAAMDEFYGWWLGQQVKIFPWEAFEAWLEGSQQRAIEFMESYIEV